MADALRPDTAVRLRNRTGMDAVFTGTVVAPTKGELIALDRAEPDSRQDFVMVLWCTNARCWEERCAVEPIPTHAKPDPAQPTELPDVIFLNQRPIQSH